MKTYMWYFSLLLFVVIVQAEGIKSTRCFGSECKSDPPSVITHFYNVRDYFLDPTRGYETFIVYRNFLIDCPPKVQDLLCIENSTLVCLANGKLMCASDKNLVVPYCENLTGIKVTAECTSGDYNCRYECLPCIADLKVVDNDLNILQESCVTVYADPQKF